MYDASVSKQGTPNTADDIVTLTFSESLSGSLVGGGTLSGSLANNLFVLAGSGTFSPTNSIVTSVVGNIITIKAGTGSSLINDSIAPTDTVRIKTALTLQDITGNGQTALNAVPFRDVNPPMLLSSETRDSDHNGLIDGIFLTFDEIVTGSVLSTGTISGFTVTGAVFSGNTALLNLVETGSANTALTPFVQLSGSTIQDVSGNITTQSGSSLDRAQPVLLS